MNANNGNQQPTQPQISKASKAAIIAELQSAIATLQTQDANVSHLVECRQKIDFASELAAVYLRDPSTFNPMGQVINNPYGYPGMCGIIPGIYQNPRHPQMQPMYPNNPHYMGTQPSQRAQGSTAPEQQPMAYSGGGVECSRKNRLQQPVHRQVTYLSRLVRISQIFGYVLKS